jgi:glycosyltransferase involved in cell wall biosynthesis
LGVELHHVPIDARGLSPLRDAALLISYLRLMRRLRPSAFLGFTVKPNLYGSIAADRLGIPVLNTITGLGTAFLSGPALRTITVAIYRHALRKSQSVFFHNCDDRDLFVSQNLVRPTQARIVAGSGVDLEHFLPAATARQGETPTFLFVGRLLRDKGAKEFAEAASIVREVRSAKFLMLGSVENHPKAVQASELQRFVSTGIVELLGETDDVRPFMEASDCIVLPSYREGLPRVLLEAAAMAKPVIATDVPGCRSVVDDGRTGLLCEPRSSLSLAKAMTAFLSMSPQDRLSMGLRGREKAEQEFSQENVVDAYLDALRITPNLTPAAGLPG